MRIAILGDGAMGSLFGGYLSKRNDVTIIGRNPEHGETFKKGLTIVEADREETFHPAYTTDSSGMQPVDLVILFVKSMANESVLETNKTLFDKHTYLLTFQNGAGHENVMSKFVPMDHVIIGTTQHNASLVSVGKVRHGGGGTCTIGTPGGDISGLSPIVKVLCDAGFSTTASSSVKRAIWNKLSNNTSVSITTAVLQCSMEYLAKDPSAWSIVESLCRETMAVAKADGYPFDEQKTLDDLHALCKAAHGGYTSFYTDIKNGRKTEVDRISGYVVERAHELGIHVPKQELMVSAIHALENKPHEA
jgi:2-dehydropantoate 2-reductase